jgi:adenylylsulfate kinase-like enzyme
MAKTSNASFWLSGMAGAGKSTIAHTVAHHYFEQGRLAASFFS